MQIVLEEIRRNLKEERAVVVERISSGNAADFSEYKMWIGTIVGLDGALAIVTEVERRMDED